MASFRDISLMFARINTALPSLQPPHAFARRNFSRRTEKTVNFPKTIADLTLVYTDDAVAPFGRYEIAGAPRRFTQKEEPLHVYFTLSLNLVHDKWHVMGKTVDQMFDALPEAVAFIQAQRS